MANSAIYRRSLCFVAADAKVHGQVLRFYSDRLLRHIAVALLATDTRLDVRRMPELDVRCGIKPVDALPRRLLSFDSVGREFLDLRFVRGDHLMARHAKSDAWNSGVRPLRYACVATGALHAMLEMKFVIEGNRLGGDGLQKEKFSDCTKHSSVSGSKNGGNSHRRIIGLLRNR